MSSNTKATMMILKDSKRKLSLMKMNIQKRKVSLASCLERLVMVSLD